MTDLPDAAFLTLLSDLFPIQLTFCFCLFGFFGTIISTSAFLKWQQRQSIIANNKSSPPPPPQSLPMPHETNQLQQHCQTSSPQSSQYVSVSNNTSHESYTYVNQHNNFYLPAQSCLPYTNTQIILDWDDTLFPTAYTILNMRNGKTNSSNIDKYDWQQLQELEDCVCNLLLMYIQLFGASNICIVTNAKLLWWNESCLMYKKLYSRIRNLLLSVYQIQIISAYDLYRRQKSCAFMDILRNKNNINKVICIGDSTIEYNAIQFVCNVLRVTSKRDINYYRFKFLESPSLNAMIEQLDSIKKLDYNIISTQKYDLSHQFK